MDTMPPSEGGGAGSIPAGSNIRKSALEADFLFLKKLEHGGNRVAPEKNIFSGYLIFGFYPGFLGD